MCKIVTLDKWADIHRYARHGWLFRGQREFDWKLKTSLERCFSCLKVKRNDRREIEERIIREFRRAYHQFAQHVPNKKMTDEWLSIMQHHGAPTRLLDVTYSIYVAAYFAIEEADGDSAVWAIDAPWAKKRSASLVKHAGKKNSALLKTVMDDDGIVTKLLMKKPCVSAAVPMNPFRLNERLRVQQGAFLIQGNISKTFSENLHALLRNTDTNRILKIRIPKSYGRKPGSNCGRWIFLGQRCSQDWMGLQKLLESTILCSIQRHILEAHKRKLCLYY